MNTLTIKNIGYLLGIIILSILCAVQFIFPLSHYLTIITFFALVFVAFSFLKACNKTQKQIISFLDAAENNDSSILFNTQKKNKHFVELYTRLNKINTRLSEAKQNSSIREQYYEKIIEQSSTGIITYDETGRIEIINSFAKKLLNCGSVQNISRFENKDITNALEQINDTDTFNVISTINGHSKHLKFNFSKISFNQNVMHIATVHDIKSDIDAKELDSWQKLIRVLTHEIMNSIAPISSIAKTLKGLYTETNESITDDTIQSTNEGLTVIEEQSERLMHFITSYRELSKLPEPQFNLFEVEAFYEKIQFLFKDKLMQKNISLSINVSPFDLKLNADEKLINHVIINLIKNAINALEYTENASIKLNAYRKIGGQVILTVENNGEKIESEIADKIFIPFFTTKEEGSGIGLSLSRQIMQLHNGSIELSTQEDFTQFSLLF